MRFPSREYWSGFLFLPPLTEDTCKKRNYKMVPRRQNRVFEIGDVGERLTNLGRGGEVGKGLVDFIHEHPNTVILEPGAA